MRKPQSYYQQIQDKLVNWMKKVQTKLAEEMGPLGEPVSPKNQMAAFKAMTPQDWVRMAEERGTEATEDYRRDMLHREAASEAQRGPL